MSSGSAENPFEIVANYTYDWETWFSPQGKVKWINPAVERMTGYSIEDCLAMKDYPAGLIHPQDRRRIQELLRIARTGTSGNDVEFRLKTKDGRTGWAAVSWQPMSDRDGRSLGFRTSMRDISERKEVEATLRVAMAEAERANASKTRFLAAVSHDLRQPLQAISMFIAALQAGQVTETQAGVLTDVQYCLDSGNELLDGLLDVSRLDAGAITPKFANVCVGDILEAIEASMTVSAAENGNKIAVVQTSRFVRTDPAMLQRILQNLVSNAIRYTYEGRILIGCRTRGNRLSIEVWDTGIGIAADQFEQIFEEFYQIGNPQRDRRRGIGLGLAIVQRLADLLQAQLTVRSQPGLGSVFAVSLEISRDICAPRVRPQLISDMPLAGHCILIVDDEPMQLRSLRYMLESCGAEVLDASSAFDAIKLVRDAPEAADLAIVDYRLADNMNGLDVVEAMRKYTGQVKPAIILTGDTEPGQITEVKANRLSVLHKPIKAEALIQSIVKLL